MQTVGEYLKNARVSRGISLKKLEKITKIKASFISLIEKNDWNNLPSYAVTSGFIKNISLALKISQNTTSAMFRRDYPIKKEISAPKQEINSKFSWSPKITFILAVSLVTIFVIGYLVFEYIKFISPPDIKITKPLDGEVVLSDRVKVSGSTKTDVVLTINNQPVILDINGNFETEIEVNKDTKELKFEAVSRSGKKAYKTVRITVDTE